MTRTLSIAVAFALLASGALVGTAAEEEPAAARASRDLPPEVIELWVPGCEPRNGRCRYWYELRDVDGRRSGDFVTSNQPYLDRDGDVVGRHRLEWLSSPNTSKNNLLGFVTFIASLRPSAHSERGTITAIGFLDLRSLTAPTTRVSELAITGGTGAYRGASGYMTEVYDPERDDFAITYHLTPNERLSDRGSVRSERDRVILARVSRRRPAAAATELPGSPGGS